MKAMVYRHYGGPEQLHLEDLPRPVPRMGEVLVRVRASSINSWDWDLLTGKPREYRLMFGLFRPRFPVIGSDIAGEVVALGDQVTRFRPGDAVFGDISGAGFGAFAEYAAVPANLLALKPQEMSFEEAAAIPQAGVLALQGLQMAGPLSSNQKVLINGAGGGVGSFAIQLARLQGVEVTAVDRAEKLGFMQSLGADKTLDCTQTDYTRTGKTYDLILDNIARRPARAYKRALKPEGTFVMVGGKTRTILQILTVQKWFSGSKSLKMLAHKPSAHDLERLGMHWKAGKLRVAVDRVFPLEALPEAMQWFSQGTFCGKIVINIP